MIAFCGQDYCSVDANGRLKLSSRFLSDFSENGGDEVILLCLPEGAIAVYPEAVYKEMRRSNIQDSIRIANSLVSRRELRRFGSMSQSEKISNQGRLTLSNMQRTHAGINIGDEIVVVGVEIGIEIWNRDRWAQESSMIQSHLNEKGEIEMAGDLLNENHQ